MKTRIPSRFAIHDLLCFALAFPPAACAQGVPPLVIIDGVGDATARRTDPGADGSFDPAAHPPIDLREVRLGAWAPLAPAADLFTGSFSASGDFVRLDLIVMGVVNPPGSAQPDEFNPFEFGDRPVFGFVEIDMDQDVQTGGELSSPCYHYLGNTARFGGKTARPDFQDRVALDASACDDGFFTPPLVKRHGEEFHLAFRENEGNPAEISHLIGNDNAVFEAGETWNISGQFFHRAHGYEPFSLVDGGDDAGQYMPHCTLQFRHDPSEDVTCISLVFPLTNTGAGLMAGQPPEPLDHTAANQSSVLEALTDLQVSATVLAMLPPPAPPEQAIIDGWQFLDPSDYLDPTQWAVTVLFGNSYVEPDPSGEYFVWTDAYPNVVRGDVNGDGLADLQDQQRIQAYILHHDEDDGQLDGAAVIPEFGQNFSIFDIDQNGVCDSLDALLVGTPGDFDADGDVDLRDYSKLMSCFSGANASFADAACALTDYNLDGDIDLDDASMGLTGPVD